MSVTMDDCEAVHCSFLSYALADISNSLPSLYHWNKGIRGCPDSKLSSVSLRLILVNSVKKVFRCQRFTFW